MAEWGVAGVDRLSAQTTTHHRLLQFGVCLAMAMVTAGCDARDVFKVRMLTPHDRYAAALTRAGLDTTAMGREWLRASDSAMRSAYPVALPFREAAAYSRAEARAVAFRMPLLEGQRFQVEVRSVGLPAQVFVDLFRMTGDTAQPFAHVQTGTTGTTADLSIDTDIEESGAYVVRIQPELLREGRLDIVARTGPSLGFPVQGATNRSVQSFFGADRDGGRRRHEGIDIFAPRGTPVLAVSDGSIRSTRPNELGGNVVWLLDESRGIRVYYAHLDSGAVDEGQAVQKGDTLGWVGNTGNARTTKPHLHFGIYRRGSGAVDPYPWVRQATAELPLIVADTGRVGRVARVASARTLMRRAPSFGADSVRSLAGVDSLRVMGASGEFYRVQLASGASGYIGWRGVASLATSAASTARPRVRATNDTRE